MGAIGDLSRYEWKVWSEDTGWVVVVEVKEVACLLEIQPLLKLAFFPRCLNTHT